MQTTLAPIRRLSNWLRTGPASRSERPPNVSWLLEHLKERAEAPALTAGRTPTASLYRMYEYIVVGFTMGLRTEIEFFFNQGPTWAVSSIPDPEDPDPQRYVILSVLPFYLCKAFNRLIERGLPRGSPAIIAGDAELEELRSRPIVLEKEPEWAAKVPALAERVVLPGPDGCEPPEETWSKGFWRRISSVKRLISSLSERFARNGPGVVGLERPMLINIIELPYTSRNHVARPSYIDLDWHPAYIIT